MDLRPNVFCLWRCAFANLLYRRAPGEIKSAVDADVEEYIRDGDLAPKTGTARLAGVLLRGEKSFRNLFYYRFRRKKLLCAVTRVFLPAPQEIELYANIGGGVHLASGFMVVGPEKTGKHLHIGAGVIVGKSGGGCPVFGENVTVGANSTIIGSITIGNNVRIEPGSVVTKDVPDGTVYGGNPARLIRRIDEEETRSVREK